MIWPIYLLLSKFREGPKQDGPFSIKCTCLKATKAVHTTTDFRVPSVYTKNFYFQKGEKEFGVCDTKLSNPNVLFTPEVSQRKRSFPKHHQPSEHVVWLTSPFYHRKSVHFHVKHRQWTYMSAAMLPYCVRGTSINIWASTWGHLNGHDSFVPLWVIGLLGPRERVSPSWSVPDWL